MARRQSTLGFEQTLIYGQYSEDLAKFARTQARTPSRLSQQSNQFLKKSLFRRLTGKQSSYYTLDLITASLIGKRNIGF